MEPIYYNLILTLLAAIAAILQVSGKVHDGRFKWINGFTKQGGFLIVILFLSIIFSFLKDYQTKIDNDKKEKTQQKEKLKDDLINRKIITNNTTATINTFTSALAKYGLKYDEAEKRIQRLIKDSSKKETKITYGNAPELSLCNIKENKINGDSLKLDFVFCVTNANVYHINMNIYCIADEFLKPYQYINLPNYKEFITDSQLDMQNLLTYNMTFHPFVNVHHIYFILTGTYSDLDNKTYKYKILCGYDVKLKAFVIPNNPTRSPVLNIFRQNGVKY